MFRQVFLLFSFRASDAAKRQVAAQRHDARREDGGDAL